MMTRSSLVLLLTLLALGVHAANVPLAARVNGVGITQNRLDRTFEIYLEQQGVQVAAIRDPERYKAMKRQVLDMLISQELLWQDAQRNDTIASQEAVDQALDEVRASLPSPEAFRNRAEKAGFTEETFAEDVKQRLSVQSLVATVIAKDLTASDEEIHEFYVGNPNSFRAPEQIRVRHILIQSEESDEAAASARIKELLAEARGGADFAELAKKHSQGPSAPKGGDLGFVTRGQLVPAFEQAAFALKPGQISDVVETSYGYHIIKMEERKDEHMVPEAEVKERVREYLVGRKTQEALQERTKTLREKGDVEILAPL